MTRPAIHSRRWGSGWTARFEGERPAVDHIWPTAEAAERAAALRFDWSHNLQMDVETFTRTIGAARYWRMSHAGKIIAEAPEQLPGDVEAARRSAETCGYDFEVIDLSEPVDLHDGPELQHLVPGVEAVPLVRRQLARETRRRAARRGDAPLPAGGLFDDVARAQQDLFS